MRSRTAAAFAALALGLVLAGCGGSTGGTSTSGGGGYGMPADGGAPDGSTLATSPSSLGRIVVDGTGLTVYMFDTDTKGAGTSACTGTCLVNWPPVTSDAQPKLDGVTGTIGLIPSGDGAQQITLDGWPLYYYAGDKAAGDVNGQGVGGVWWVLSADGTPVRE